MSFAHPLWLWALVLPVALLVWETRRRGPRVALPLDHAPAMHRTGLHRLVVGTGLLPALLLALGIVLAARPQRLAPPAQEREQSAIEFCLDVSVSMESKLGNGMTAFEAATQAITDFTVKRAGDAFGLTIFGNQSLRWVPGTKDLAVIRQAVTWVRPNELPHHFGGTKIANALRACLGTMGRITGGGDRLIVLVSDGMSSDLDQGTVPELSREFAAAGVGLFMIYIGDGQPQEELQAICASTGGAAFTANDPGGLARVFTHIDRMRPARLRNVAASSVDWFRPFALAGLALLGSLSLARFALRFTPW